MKKTMTNETIKNLEIEISNLEKFFFQNKKDIIKRYLSENNPYKVGDIFTDHIGSIKIENMGYSISLREIGESCMTYSGKIINKDGSFSKKGLIRTAYQSNEVKK